MIFQKFNANPKEWKREGDCVVRAISVANNVSWQVTYLQLCELGEKRFRMPNSKPVYEEYLKKQGFVKYKMPKHYDNTRYTVRELIDENPNITMVISVANHLTCAIKGTLYDTWDCSHKSVGNYYIKQ